MSVKGFRVTTSKLERFFTSNSQFVGVFPADKKGENFIKFSNDLKGKKKVFVYDSEHRSAKKPGVHWWSLLDTEEKDTLFSFDSFGSHGLLHFIVENDLPIFNKLIPEQFKQIFKRTIKQLYLNGASSFRNTKNSSGKNSTSFLIPQGTSLDFHTILGSIKE